MSKLPYRLIFMLGVLAFFITIAIIIGQRMSTEAMAVLMGVIAGVAASIPTSLLVAWIAMQTIKPTPAPAHPAPRAEPVARNEPPQIVVLQQPAQSLGYNPQGISQAQAHAQQGWNMNPYSQAQAPLPRKFTVIGGNAEAEDLPQLQPLEMVM
jgi:hypothetical protein